MGAVVKANGPKSLAYKGLDGAEASPEIKVQAL